MQGDLIYARIATCKPWVCASATMSSVQFCACSCVGSLYSAMMMQACIRKVESPDGEVLTITEPGGILHKACKLVHDEVLRE